MHKLSNDILHILVPNRMKANKSFNLNLFDNNFKFPDIFSLISQLYEIGEILLYQHIFYVVQHPIYMSKTTTKNFTPECYFS